MSSQDWFDPDDNYLPRANEDAARRLSQSLGLIAATELGTWMVTRWRQGRGAQDADLLRLSDFATRVGELLRLFEEVDPLEKELVAWFLAARELATANERERGGLWTTAKEIVTTRDHDPFQAFPQGGRDWGLIPEWLKEDFRRELESAAVALAGRLAGRDAEKDVAERRNDLTAAVSKLLHHKASVDLIRGDLGLFFLRRVQRRLPDELALPIIDLVASEDGLAAWPRAPWTSAFWRQALARLSIAGAAPTPSAIRALSAILEVSSPRHTDARRCPKVDSPVTTPVRGAPSPRSFRGLRERDRGDQDARATAAGAAVGGSVAAGAVTASGTHFVRAFAPRSLALTP